MPVDLLIRGGLVVDGSGSAPVRGDVAIEGERIAAVAEIIFGLPGVGYQLLHAIFQRDYPVVQASVLIIATTFVVVNFFVDLLYGVLDPRISVT